MITHFLKFTDEAAAKKALPEFWLQTEDGWTWRRDVVDGPIREARSYCLNIGLPALNEKLSGLIGAVDEAVTFVFGDQPQMPQREFAQSRSDMRVALPVKLGRIAEVLAKPDPRTKG